MKRQANYKELSYVGVRLQPTSICTGVELAISRRAISKLLSDRLKRPIDENVGQNLEDVEALQQVMNILAEENGA